MNDKFLKLRKELLNEAVELDSGEVILKAFQRGQIIGVKYKEFGIKTQEDASKFVVKMNSSILPSLKEAIQSPSDLNKYVMLFLKKSRNFNSFIKLYTTDIERILDSSSAYFGNINKREVKENLEIQKRFTEFYNSPYDTTKDLEFERWANETFAQKASMKAGDVVQIYNKDGWEIVRPLTFAAAKQYACMNNRKATWCTSARSSYFKSYSANGKNPLYIIRNKEKDKMYQMDFGEGGRSPNFKKENDLSITVGEATTQIPKDVLNALKDSEGKSVANLFKDEVKENKGIVEGGEWKETIFTSIGEFEKEIEPYQKPDILGGGALSKLTLETAISRGKNINTISKLGKLTNGKKTFYYIFPTNSIHIKQKSGEKEMGKFVFQLVGDRLLVKSLKGFLKLDLPRNLKTKFMDTEESMPERQEDISGSEFRKTELGGTAFYEGINSIESLEKIENEKHLNNIKRSLISGRRDPKEGAVYGYDENNKYPFMLYVDKNGYTRGGSFVRFLKDKATGERSEVINIFKRNNLFGLDKLSQKEFNGLVKVFAECGTTFLKDYGEFTLHFSCLKAYYGRHYIVRFGIKEEVYNRAIKKGVMHVAGFNKNIVNGEGYIEDIVDVLRILKATSRPEDFNTIKNKIRDAVKISRKYKEVASIGIMSSEEYVESEIKKIFGN